MRGELALLNETEIEAFIRDGYVRIEGAVAPTTVEAALDILWRDIPADRAEPATWRQPVVRLGHYAQAPFREAANAPVLREAFDQLVGPGRWRPAGALGTFVVRFPSPEDPGDTGWHVDMSFGEADPNFMNWRINLASKGRALLMLFLLTDVGPEDAPTRLRAGSHVDIARQLAPAGEEGLTLGELAADGFAGSAHRLEVLATGGAGTVYLCHPFLVHAGQPHWGESPRIIAQPPLLPAGEFDPRAAQNARCPVEDAIALALGSGE